MHRRHQPPAAGRQAKGQREKALQSAFVKARRQRPSPTIQGQPGPWVGPFHWESRRLRVAEIKRLFTYPDEFELVGNRNSVQAQLGNSVPPLLAQKVIAQVAEALGG